MSDLDRPIEEPSDDEDRQAGETVFNILPCPRCHAELGHLPIFARFCPQCGQDMRAMYELEDEPPGRVPPPIPLAARLLVPGQADQDNRSPILRGYAHAMFRLGRVYERSLGSRQNRDEAYRCFLKAAKLGDAEAQNTLNGQVKADPPQA